MEDPAAIVGTDERKREVFRSTLVTLTRRIELLLNLRLEKLDRLSLQRRLSEIGKS